MKISPSATGVLILAVVLPLFWLLFKKLFKRRTRSGTTTTSSVVAEEKTQEIEARSSSKVRCDNHEVFLSFRGTDTRNTFTDHLYSRLIDAGIDTFIDSEALHIGDSIGPKLIEAIKNSKILIPIFSSDFASSHWCLREVATMVECIKYEGYFIFPIFYDVEPSHVRHQKGTYEEAFKNLEKSFPKEVEVWKKALKEVANLSGLEVTKTFDGRQGKIIKMLVLKVLGKLRKKDLSVTDCLVGMDTHVKEIKKLLSVERDGVSIVGIHGMGGIGKTTAARVVYNELLTDVGGFDYCSFLANVRENSQQHKGIVNLQNQLLSGILNHSFDVTTVDQGLDVIKDKFRNKKVLIVLDDVSKRSHLKELGVKHDWFGSGSRIIVTTRNKDVLDVPEIDSTYEITVLNDSQSLQLFCKHAFGSDFNHPPEEYYSLSEDVVASASGLPLALESIGSSLFGMAKDKWNATIEKLKKIPHDEVETKLRISYDGLDKGQQEIFLDISCLFNGVVDKIIASYMWVACGFFPEIDIEFLLLRSLVKYGDKNELRMHDHYVSLGRKIVHDENYIDPGERTRLWNYMDALRILESGSGTRKVEALCLNLKYEARGNCFNSEDFEGLLNLRFLQFLNADITGDFKRRFLNLIWLEWKGCPQNFRATNFHPKKLVILDLSRSRVSETWEGWKQLQVAKYLKVLDLTGCHFLTRTPDFSYYPYLERLTLQDCKNLVHIDSSIGHLKRLVFLNMKYCKGVEELPKEFSSLQALEELFIDGTSLQEVPTSIGGMKKLKTLSAKGYRNLNQVTSSIGDLESLSDFSLFARRITELPYSIGSLVKLCRLSLHCPSLRILPESIGKLESLTELHLIGAECTELPNSIGDLKNLIVLDIIGCSKMNKLPDSIGNLENLRVLSIQRTSVMELPDAIGRLEKLEQLNASSCSCLKGGLPESIGRQTSLKVLILARTPIESIHFISGLSNLQTLDLLGCKNILFLPELPSSLKILTVPSGLLMGTLPRFSLLINLEKLDFSSCSMLVEIPREIGELSGLRELVIQDCSRLECLPVLPSSLLKLSITKCSSMKLLGCLSSLEKLSEVGVYYCSELTEIQDLGKFELLTILKVHGCQKLAKVDGLQQLIYLRELNLDWCDSLATIPNLSKLKMLRLLKVHYCKELREIEGLEALELLEKLDLAWCGSLERLSDLSNLKNLKVLILIWCSKSLQIQGVEELNSLERLSITSWASIERWNLSDLVMLDQLALAECENLREIEGLEALRSLENLGLSGCEKLTEIQGIKELISLRQLEINGCSALEEFPGLSKLELLDSLKLIRCEKLREIGDLEGLQSLRIVVLSQCASLERLPNFSNLQNLNELQLQNCDKLNELQAIEELKSLRHLEIKGCKALEKLPDLSKLELLEWLALVQWEKLHEIWSLEGLQSLQVLDLSQCTSLGRLPNLSNLQNLNELYLQNCEKLTELQGIEELKSLHYLNIQGCEALVTLPDLSKIRIVMR